MPGFLWMNRSLMGMGYICQLRGKESMTGRERNLTGVELFIFPANKGSRKWVQPEWSCDICLKSILSNSTNKSREVEDTAYNQELLTIRHWDIQLLAREQENRCSMGF